jgi:alkyl sulfatase BDS1-like metallo-beta-lactamase superfamily hydrolase
VARYLSEEWFDEANRAAADSGQLMTDTAGLDLAIQQVVTEAPEGEIRYTVRVRDGRVTLTPGDDPTADVTFTEDWDTARRVAAGELNAPTAFMTGRIRVAGNVAVLLDAQGSLQGLDKVFADLRDRTTF